MADEKKTAKPGRIPRKRIAKGPPRPHYLESPDLDRTMIILIALVSELLALRDRLNTHEVILERDGKLSPAAVEAFRPPAQLEDAREEERLAILRRIFRVLRDEFEHHGAPDPARAASAEAA